MPPSPLVRATATVASLLTLAACAPGGDGTVPDTFCDAPSHYFLCGGVRNMAHRGGSKLAPEDTLAAFEHAAALGVDVLEMDVHSTADGQIVVLHDDTVDRTTDGAGPVTGFTLDSLQALDAAFHFSPDGGVTFPLRGTGVVIPALYDVLAAFPDAHLSIEIKQQEPSIVDGVLDLLDAFDARDRVVIASFLDPVMTDLRAKAPDLLTTYTLSEMFQWSQLTEADDATYAPPAPVVQAPVDTLTDEMIALAQRHGVAVQVWTVNDRAEMDRLIQLDVDGILTDDPVMLAQVIDEANATNQVVPTGRVAR